MRDYREASRFYYDLKGDSFGKDKTRDYWNFVRNYLADCFNIFFNQLPGRNILDLGSGPGRDALFFRENGFQPICVDIATNMARATHRQGLLSCVGDAEELPFADNSFAGVWAYTSLLHMPKNKFPDALREIERVLDDSGVLFLGMKEGCFDGFAPVQNECDISRYIALYTHEELLVRLQKSKFDVVHSSSVRPDKTNVYLNYVCKKR